MAEALLQKDSITLSELQQLNNDALVEVGAKLGLEVSASSLKSALFSDVKQLLYVEGKISAICAETISDSVGSQLPTNERTMSYELEKLRLQISLEKKNVQPIEKSRRMNLKCYN